MPKTVLNEVIELPKEEEELVEIKIPLAESDSNGVAVDQTDCVTINGKNYLIKRGERVSVPVPVFIQLRNKYPDI